MSNNTNEFYEKAANEIFQSLQRNEDNEYDFNKHDVVWEDSATGGKLFLGGESAASNLALLQAANVKRIVNCRGRQCPDTLERQKNLKFFRMSITSFSSAGCSNPDKVWSFFKDFFAFVDEGLSRGESVLIHCLAGAHRAPTSAAAYLLYKTRMDVPTVSAHLKSCRPIVDLRSFGGSSTLLTLVYTSLQELNYPAAAALGE